MMYYAIHCLYECVCVCTIMALALQSIKLVKCMQIDLLYRERDENLILLKNTMGKASAIDRIHRHEHEKKKFF